MTEKPLWLVAASNLECRAIASGFGLQRHSFPTGSPPCVTGSRRLVLLLNAGMGVTATLTHLERLLESTPCSGMISMGYCGALQRGLRSGTALVYDSCGLLDEDGTVRQWFNASAPMSAELSGILEAGGIARRNVRALTSPVIVADQADKLRLGKEFDCAAVDMETAAVFAVCRRLGIACAALRVVLDEATHTLPPTEGLMDNQGRLRKGATAALAIRSPRSAQMLRQLRLTADSALRCVGGALRGVYDEPVRLMAES